MRTLEYLELPQEVEPGHPLNLSAVQCHGHHEDQDDNVRNHIERNHWTETIIGQFQNHFQDYLLSLLLCLFVTHTHKLNAKKLNIA